MIRSSIAVALLLSYVALGDELSDLLGQVDALHARRDEPGVIDQERELLNKGLKQHADDYGVLWRAARLKFWIADGSSGDQKKQLGKDGWILGDLAIRQNPKGVEGQYFAAVGMGAYSQAVGILKALTEGLEGKFNERLDAAIQIDPDLSFGGPLVAKGRYYYELPWPKRSLSKSAALLNQVIQKFPQNLRAYVYLADTQLKDGDAKKAKETLAKAEAGSVDYDPPEGRRAKEMAKVVKAKIEEELR